MFNYGIENNIWLPFFNLILKNGLLYTVTEIKHIGKSDFYGKNECMPFKWQVNMLQK